MDCNTEGNKGLPSKEKKKDNKIKIGLYLSIIISLIM